MTMNYTEECSPAMRKSLNSSLLEFNSQTRKNLATRAKQFYEHYKDQSRLGRALYSRRIISPMASTAQVWDPLTKQSKTMLMFGSNNYLGLANHSYVIEKVKSAVADCGAGLAGPPLLNGMTSLHRSLEEKLAEFKGAKDCLLVPSGFQANLCIIDAFASKDDAFVYDAYSHASLLDGLRLAKARCKFLSLHFEHNNLLSLQKKLTWIKQNKKSQNSDIYVCCEGVYSMDGDLAPLDKIAQICKASQAYLIVDDAHGTGVVGREGRGTASFFDCESLVDVTMGTFSKAFAVGGGFIAGSKEIITYLRFFARPYVFSAHISLPAVAAVLAGLDVLAREPELITRLAANAHYMKESLQREGFKVVSETAIIPIRLPAWVDIRKFNYDLHTRGVFANAIEYPAVQVDEQRIRLSIMATHSKKEIDKAVSIIAEVGRTHNIIK